MVVVVVVEEEDHEGEQEDEVLVGEVGETEDGRSEEETNGLRSQTKEQSKRQRCRERAHQK